MAYKIIRREADRYQVGEEITAGAAAKEWKTE